MVVSSGSTRGIYVVLLLLRMLTLELFLSRTMKAIIRPFFTLGCIIMCLLVNYLFVSRLSFQIMSIHFWTWKRNCLSTFLRIGSRIWGR